MNIQTVDGKLVLHPADALAAIGWSANRDAAAKTARNLICAGKYPLCITTVCGKQRVLARDVLAAVGIAPPADTAIGLTALDEIPPRRRPGRPRKQAVGGAQ